MCDACGSTWADGMRTDSIAFPSASLIRSLTVPSSVTTCGKSKWIDATILRWQKFSCPRLFFDSFGEQRHAAENALRSHGEFHSFIKNIHPLSDSDKISLRPSRKRTLCRTEYDPIRSWPGQRHRAMMRVLLANNLEGRVFQEDQCLHFHLHLSRDLDSSQRRLEVLKMTSILALKDSARISIWISKFSFFC